MSEIRAIRKIVTGVPTEDGAGVKLVRVIGHSDTKDFDPFLMLDGIAAADIPVIDEGDRKIHIIAGTYKGKSGAMEGDYVKPVYLDVEVNPGAEWSLDIDKVATLIRAGRFLVYSVAAMKQAHENYGNESAMGKLYASNICQR